MAYDPKQFPAEDRELRAEVERLTVTRDALSGQVAELQGVAEAFRKEKEAYQDEVERLTAVVRKLHDDFTACGHETSARMMRAKFRWLAEHGKEAGDG